ncbi:MAG: twin-arginine translocation signal domain-containing protein, partial [Xanthomonadales bacterium]|nr:twin-arginine translocation signal domain-containing protein [Xanthomonadales bacterium]
MSDKKPADLGASRRDFLKASGLSALALGTGAALGAAGNATASPGPQPGGGGFTPGQNPGQGPYNILFLLVDQERLFRPGELPVGFHLPGHERLMKAGTTFLNHR